MIFIVTCSVLENPDFSPIAVGKMKYRKQDGFQLDNNLLFSYPLGPGQGNLQARSQKEMLRNSNCGSKWSLSVIINSLFFHVSLSFFFYLLS